MRTGWVWFLGCLLAAGAVALLLATRQPAASGGGDEDRAAAHESDLPLRSEGVEGDDEEAGAAPHLEGRPAAGAEAQEGGPVLVRVRGPGGRPLSVPLRLQRPAGQGDPAGATTDLITNAQGEAVFQVDRYDGSHRVFVARPGHQFDIPGDPVTGPQMTIRRYWGLPLTLDVVDAETGRGDVVARSRGAVRCTSPQACGATDEGMFVALGPQEEVALELEWAEVPEGWVAWDGSTWTVPVSAYAMSLQAVYPLRREVEVSLTVLDHDGTRVRAPVVPWFQAAGRTVYGPNTTAAGSHDLIVRGVPFLRSEMLTVAASRAGGHQQVTESIRLPDDPYVPIHFTLRLPPPSDENGVIGMGGGCGSSFRCRSRGHRSDRDLGTVIVEVRRYTGAPAVNAAVNLRGRTERTDASGRTRFEAVPAGSHAITVRQLGLLPIAGSVDVEAGRTARVFLQEAQGSAVRLRVVDEYDLPLPFATFAVKTPSGQGWTDERGGVQRIDPFTDERGERRIDHVESGALEFTVSWGSRRATLTLDADDGDRHDLRVVLPRSDG
ncbi:MAG: carboxypeptidase-like regulatory domain-containing protein [Planctomycetota bacterium]|jgi:hypothetical protein